MTFGELYLTMAIVTAVACAAIFLYEIYKNSPAHLKDFATYIGVLIPSAVFGFFWFIFIIVFIVDRWKGNSHD